jgi:hypothetical protein
MVSCTAGGGGAEAATVEGGCAAWCDEVAAWCGPVLLGAVLGCTIVWRSVHASTGTPPLWWQRRRSGALRDSRAWSETSVGGCHDPRRSLRDAPQPLVLVLASLF